MIKCQNQKCRKDIETPLEIFNGKFICPYCGAALVQELSFLDIGEAQYQAAARLFELSEIYFHKWQKAPTELYYRYRAVALCSRAAFKEPRAFARMTYYFCKGYLGEHIPQETRRQLAGKYIQAITQWRENHENTEYKNWLEHSAPEVLVVLSGNGGKLSSVEASNGTQGGANAIVSVINMCDNDERAPVLGIYRLGSDCRNESLSKILQEKSRRRKKKFYAYKVNEEGKLTPDKIEELSKRLASGAVSDGAMEGGAPGGPEKGDQSQLNPNDNVLIVINRQGRHDFVTGTLFSKIENFVRNNRQEIKNIVEELPFVTLFDEDFFALLKIEGYKLKDLQPYVKKYKDNN